MSSAADLTTRSARIRLQRGRTAVEIAPGVGGRISALELDGWDLFRRDGWTDNEWGSFVMAPWAGRLRDARFEWDGRTITLPANEGAHALHGLMTAVPWQVTSQGVHTVRLEKDLPTDVWPMGGRLVHTIALQPTRLVMRLEAHAMLEPTPVIMGWHPWFRRRAVRLEEASMGLAPESGDVTIDVRPLRRLDLDEDRIPTGLLLPPRDDPQDDVLVGLTEAPVIRWPGGPRLTLHASGAQAWTVYTENKDGVCVEPMTGVPDGLNGGVLGDPPVARALAPLSATFEIAWG